MNGRLRRRLRPPFATLPLATLPSATLPACGGGRSRTAVAMSRRWRSSWRPQAAACGRPSHRRQFDARFKLPRFPCVEAPTSATMSRARRRPAAAAAAFEVRLGHDHLTIVEAFAAACGRPSHRRQFGARFKLPRFRAWKRPPRRRCHARGAGLRPPAAAACGRCGRL